MFTNDTMDIMDEFPEMNGYFIIMDNAPIHVPEMIDPLIIKRGYTQVCLPLYSPELNPIEQFWSIVKTKIK
jgi:transposase